MLAPSSSSDVPAKPPRQNVRVARASAASGSYWRGRPRSRLGDFDGLIYVLYGTKISPTEEPPMELYFAPLACSLATRISLYEVGAPAQAARFTQVDTRAKRLADGGDFYAVNPMGQVPALRTD